jgi:hypothetical protein
MAVIDTINAKARNYIKKTGDAMIAGFLTLFQDPVEDMHAVTKRYVDDLVGAGFNGFDERQIMLTQQVGRASAASPAAVGMTLPGFVGTRTLVSDLTGVYQKHQGTTANGAVAGMNQPATLDYTMPMLPDIFIVIKTGPNATDLGTGVALNCGIAENTQGALGPDGPTLLFRYNTAEGDTNWTTVSSADGSSDGSLATFKDTGVPVTADTRYVFRIRVTSTTNIEYYINGVLENTHTVADNIPSTSAEMGPLAHATNLVAGTARNFRLRRWQSLSR